MGWGELDRREVCAYTAVRRNAKVRGASFESETEDRARL